MKSFHLLKGLYCGGVENLIMNWYRNIDHNHFTFDFGITSLEVCEFATEIKSYNGQIIYIPKGNSFWGKIIYLYRLYRTLQQEGPYEAFFSHEQFFGPISCMVAWIAGVKKRLTFAHWTEFSHSSALTRFLSTLISYFFVTDRFAVSEAAGYVQYGYLPFTVFHPGIEVTKFSYNCLQRAKIRQQLGISEQTLVVGNVSRLSADKNLLFLIDVFKEIIQQHSNAILVHCGSGDLEQELTDDIQQKGLTDSIKLLGNIKDISFYYQAMDAFVFPSLKEGFGLAALEAQCSGLPCFISDGVPDEAMICNTTKIPLSKSAKEWADIILDKTKDFKREDCSSKIKKAGFDIKDTAKILEQEFLK